MILQNHLKKNSLKFISVLSLVALYPFMASAACTTTDGGLCSIISSISNLFSTIVPVLIGLGVIYFIWGVIMYVIADGEEAKKKGRDSIIYGIIGLTAIVAMWGLGHILLSTFNLDNSGNNYNNVPNYNSIQNLLPTSTTP